MWPWIIGTMWLDLLTKQIATWCIPVYYNELVSRLGFDAPGHVFVSWLFVIAFVEIGRHLRVGRPWCGMAAGGTLANLASYSFGPAGVADWIPVPGIGIANIADFALLVGVTGMIYVVARQAVTESRRPGV